MIDRVMTDTGSYHYRIGIYARLPAAIENMGGRPADVLAAHGLCEDDFADPDATLPYPLLMQLLETCASRTGKPDFGLRFGALGQLEDLGLIGMLLRTAPTLTDMANEFVAQHSRLSKGGALYTVHTSESFFVGHRSLVSGASFQQLGMVTAAWGARVFEQATRISPRRIFLACRKPEGHHLDKLLQTELVFNAPEFLLEYPAAAATAPLTPGKKLPRQAVVQAIALSRRYQEGNFVDLVKRKVVALIFTGRLSAEAVADELKMQPRRLNRKLSVHNLNIRKVIDDVRLEIARQLVRDTNLPIAVIGSALGFEEPASFSRYMRNKVGACPSTWRNSLLETHETAKPE